MSFSPPPSPPQEGHPTPLQHHQTPPPAEQEDDDFSHFYNRWIAEQEAYLHELLATVERVQGRRLEEEQQQQQVRQLVDRVIGHYEHYYRAKSSSARRTVLPMFSPPWRSPTENLFLWVGGWQPSSAFHLFYSRQGHQLLSRLDEVLRGVRVGDLADISHAQLVRLDALQRRVIGLEREISEEGALAQADVADHETVRLSHSITETRWRGERGGEEEARWEAEMRAEMEAKKGRMVRVLERADRLRMETLRGVVEILEPTQAAHFLIAAAEVHLRVHELGMKEQEQ